MIDSFRGEYWFHASVENAFQAAKALGVTARKRVRECTTFGANVMALWKTSWGFCL